MRLLKPDLILKSVLEIDLEKLKKRGIRGLLIDIDNTLIPWEQSLINEELSGWARRASREGLRLCLISNAFEQRVQTVAASLDISAVGQAWKPLNRAFLRGLDLLEAPPGQVAVVGDQLFTDVFGGNRLGMFTILINPLSKREFFTTKLVRSLERRVLQLMVKRGVICAEALQTRWGGS